MDNNKKSDKQTKIKKSMITKNSTGLVSFKPIFKSKKLNLLKILQENYNIDLSNYKINSKIKKYSSFSSRNKETKTSNPFPIKNIKESLINNTNRNRSKSKSNSIYKIKDNRNMKILLFYPNKSVYQCKAKYHSKNNSSKMQYSITEVLKNTNFSTPHLRQCSKESKNQKKIYNNFFINEINNTTKNKVQIKEDYIKDSNIYFKLENIKLRCDNLLQKFNEHTNYLNNELMKYKNINGNNAGIMLKYNRNYSTYNTDH